VFPLGEEEIFGGVVLFLAIVISSAAGIGGGGIVVPICLIFFNFSATKAIALTNFCVCVSALAWFVFQLNDKHPRRDSVVIDYEIVMVMLPSTLFGAMFGIQLNTILPDIATLWLLTMVLFYMGVKTLWSAMKKFD